MPEKLHGVLVPNIVPLAPDGRIDEAELRRYIEWLIVRGVHGLYPNGSTGEFVRFTPEERREIVRIICEQSAGRVPVVAGAAEANVSETLAACEVYRSFGARAVAVVSPFYYRVGQEGVLAYFREIAAHTPIDVTLYNIPAFASPIDVRSVQILAEYPRVIGIKDSSGDIAQMGRLIRAVRLVRPEFTFLTGSEAALVPMMLIGADGGTHATAGVVPELTRRLYDLAAEARAGARGALGDAVALQLQLIELIDAMVTGLDFPEGFRAGVELRGFRMGRGRQPISEAQQAVRTALKENVRLVMRKLGVEADGSF